MIFEIETVSHNICRACLNKDPVFEISEEVYEKLKLCGGIDMEENNCKLPNKICHKCFINLEICYEFRRICQQSDKKLKEIMQNSLIEFDKHDDLLENLKFEFLVPKEEEPDEILNQSYLSHHNEEVSFDLDIDDTDTEEFFQSIRLEEGKKEFEFDSENLIISNQIHRENMQNSTAKNETKINVKRIYKKEIEDENIEKKDSSNELIIPELIRPVKFETFESTIKITDYKVENIQKKNSIDGFHTCQFCGVSYVSKFSMENHMRLHSARLRFVCEICGDSYAGKFQLDHHMCAKHTGERNFKCEYCDKAFFSKTLRNKHQKRSHSKLFKCDQCDKGFGRSDSLKKHKRVHTGEKPIVCDKCGIRFKELHHLKNHNKSMTPCIFKISIKVKDV